MQIDINNLENLVNNIESEISTTARTKAKGVTPERLSKIWSIDIETAKKTIDLTSQHVKHEGSSHLKRWYSTNDRMLQYNRIGTHFLWIYFKLLVKLSLSARTDICNCLYLIQDLCLCIQ